MLYIYIIYIFLTCHRESQGSSSFTRGCYSFGTKPPLCPIHNEFAEPCPDSFSKLLFYSPAKGDCTDNSPAARSPPQQQQQSCPRFPTAALGLGRSPDPFVPGFQAGNTVVSQSCRVSKGAKSVPQAPGPGVHSPLHPGSPSLSTLGGKFRGIGSQILLPLFGASWGEAAPAPQFLQPQEREAGGTEALFGNAALTLEREAFKRLRTVPKQILTYIIE